MTIVQILSHTQDSRWGSWEFLIQLTLHCASAAILQGGEDYLYDFNIQNNEVQSFSFIASVDKLNFSLF